MKNDLQTLMQRYHQLLESQNFDVQQLDYSIIEKHKSMLSVLGQVNKSSVSIFDLHQREHIYLSPMFAQTLHYDLEEAEKIGNDFFDSKVHPEDLLKLIGEGIVLLELCLALPPQKQKEYKLVNEYRIKNGKNEFVRVIEQHQILEHDPNNNIWLVLSIMDIAPDQGLDQLAKSRLINFKLGELYDFPPFGFEENPSPTLSSREKEVLALISKGLISKQIADKLYISVHTVNTHRQRILKKLKVSNTFEAIKYAAELGVIH